VAAEEQYSLLLAPLLPQAAGYARSILRNRDDAADAVQQAALRGLERIHTFDVRRPFKGWWFAILRNCCIDMIRRSRAAQTEDMQNLDAPEESPSDGPDWEQLTLAMSRLPEPHREILRLRYFADLSYRELAESLGIPPGTVMSRLYTARKALQARLTQDDI
jgi:RNA polymerase sigma-70 factor, ECF subfamily